MTVTRDRIPPAGEQPAAPPTHVGSGTRVLIRATQAVAVGWARHWLLLLNLFLALYLGGAYLTPYLMSAGYTGPAQALYTLYGFTCHQLPQRSYFFGGENGVIFASYPKEVLVANGADPTNDLTMRRFVGNPQLGYKAAIAHRLSGLYTGALVAGLLFRPGAAPAWVAPPPDAPLGAGALHSAHGRGRHQPPHQ
ncbi:MAG: hypothetical protein Q9O62_08190 [Ardenticatenia bacterium]|nr:hypothetical protein [Ardenticatenia bacterium]